MEIDEREKKYYNNANGMCHSQINLKIIMENYEGNIFKTKAFFYHKLGTFIIEINPYQQNKDNTKSFPIYSANQKEFKKKIEKALCHHVQNIYI